MTALKKLKKVPSIWPGKKNTGLQPGDLTRSLGNGHNCKEALFGQGIIPLKRMPISESEGGAFCFDSNRYRKNKDAFMVLMKAIGMWDSKTYAVKIEESYGAKTLVSRQMRLVSAFALQYAYKVIDEKEYKSFPEQKITMAEACWTFLQEETSGCDPPKNVYPEKSVLILIPPSIGIEIENAHYNVFRIWSRWPRIYK